MAKSDLKLQECVVTVLLLISTPLPQYRGRLRRHRSVSFPYHDVQQLGAEKARILEQNPRLFRTFSKRNETEPNIHFFSERNPEN